MKWYAALPLVGVLVLLLWPVKAIEVRSLQSGTRLYVDQVRKGFRFATLITHSVHLSPIYEYYEIGDDWKLYIRATVLQDVGWGVPSGHPIERYQLAGAFMSFAHIDRTIPFLPFRISYISEPRLIFGKELREIYLPNHVPDGDRLDVSLNTLPYVLLAWRERRNAF